MAPTVDPQPPPGKRQSTSTGAHRRVRCAMHSIAAPALRVQEFPPLPRRRAHAMNQAHTGGGDRPAPDPPDGRLDSWKKIAAYLKRDVSTVQRWERREAMPVHRHLHDKQGSVYAFRSELDAWWRSRGTQVAGEAEGESEPPQECPPGGGIAPPVAARRVRRLRYWWAAGL